jgi:phosphopantetheine adenylyltransferase
LNLIFEYIGYDMENEFNYINKQLKNINTFYFIIKWKEMKYIEIKKYKNLKINEKKIYIYYNNNKVIKYIYIYNII